MLFDPAEVYVLVKTCFQVDIFDYQELPDMLILDAVEQNSMGCGHSNQTSFYCKRSLPMYTVMNIIKKFYDGHTFVS